MSWVETTSPNFSARHEEDDADDVGGGLELLEGTRERLAEAFPELPGHVAVVVHGSPFQLALAQPYLPIIRRLTAPAARRYLVGWFQHDEIHVLAPRVLAERASNVPGSKEMNLLAPAALYTQLAIGASSPRLPPPFRPQTFVRYVRWAWLAAGAAQYFAGQTAFARPAIARRLREGRQPSFPPGVRDAQLLGGSVVDLVARERGEQAAARLAVELHPRGPREALVDAFGGRPLRHTEAAWRAHLARIAAGDAGRS
ncbi:MAG TPA: hypothetical protein VHB30_08905 [Solirubrobacteraceae bacterium]|nr:hypothetical protein [Solirubrobacteraceae bacterium]